MDKYAAIDLGTNTFHLLIVSLDEEERLVEHFRERRYIHLAEDGIDYIGDAAFSRAIECLKDYGKILGKYNISKISCSGTAALRRASNGQELTNRILRETGIKVDTIDGIQEARFIFDGVKLAVPEIDTGNHVIMDIGGGSVEFIIIENGHFRWSDSFPIGIAVLKNKFHKQEPISREEIQKIDQFLESKIRKFLFQCRLLEIENLIGASGSFEILAHMSKEKCENSLSMKVGVEFFEKTYSEMVRLNLEERLNRSDIPDDRAHLIVVAFQIMKYIISKINPSQIIVSEYAMKEGMIHSLLKTK